MNIVNKLKQKYNDYVHRVLKGGVGESAGLVHSEVQSGAAD